MTQFQLWFAYYDSLFLNAYPKLSNQFYMDHILKNVSWPNQVCPVVSAIYHLLQNFIQDQNNWKLSECQEVELEAIERDIDDLMHFLQVEKVYAHTFWEKDLRRIQASVVHFYTFLQLFIRALIPYPTMTLYQCKAANKLCIELAKLEKLINSILKCVNQIAKFLLDPKFSDQFKLIKNFFANWVQLMKKMPKIKRNNLNHVHKLVQFLCLTNPIQICSGQKILFKQSIRKKSNTVGDKIEIKTHPHIEQYKSQLKFEKAEIESEKSEKKRRSSCICFNNRKLEEFSYSSNKQRIILFRLPEQIIKYSKETQIRKKKMSLQSLSTLQNKIDTISKIRTKTTNQTRRFTKGNFQISPIQTKRHKAMSFNQINSPVKSASKRSSNHTIAINEGPKKRKATKFYQQQSQRNQQIMSVRSSKQSTIRNREKSIMTIILKKNQQNQYINEALFGLSSPKVSMATGKAIGRSKWEIVRNYVKQRIKIRKIKKLLSL